MAILNSIPLSYVAILGMTALSIILVMTVVMYRTLSVLFYKFKPNSWSRLSINTADPDYIIRFQHAHLNCMENLPILIAIVFVAAQINRLHLIDSSALYFLFFRVCQSFVHCYSTSSKAVSIRATFFLLQIFMFCYWLYLLYNN